MGKQKAKGTARETRAKRDAEAVGLEARRAENNLPGRDVDIVADRLRIVEVKDRQQLNVHKTLADTARRWPNLPPAVLWHRTSVKAGNAKASPDGPTLLALPWDDYLDLLAVAKHAYALVVHNAPDSRYDLGLALAAIDRKWPNQEVPF